jgi:long-chain acyl-CoA synthetase
MLIFFVLGEPKIAMLSHDNLLASTRGNLIRLDRANIKKPVTNRHCSFLPMAHIFERFVILQILLKGTEVVFCPAPEKLIEYLSKVKPTQASVVPRILNKVYDTVMTDVNKSKLKQLLVKQALREQPPFLSRFVFRKLRDLFGGDLKGIITGSAPLKPDVLHFFRVALDIPIIEGYGQTESSAAGSTTHPIDMSYGTVGSPGLNIEIKLIDVPGTIYRSEMNQGEVCLRGPTIFKGKPNSISNVMYIYSAQ